MSYTLYTPPGSFRAFKILIAAEFNAIDIEIPDYDSEKVVSMSPSGKAPVLKLPSGKILFESNSIAKYIAKLRKDTGLMGQNGSFQEKALIEQWCDFSANVLELPACVWWYPAVGYMAFSKEAYEKAKLDFGKALSILENHLSGKDFLVGGCISLADITVVSALVYPMKLVCEEGYLKDYDNVVAWFKRCVEMKEFQNVIGNVTFCKKELKPKNQKMHYI
jgi:elongation factor 1-gamma